MFTLLIVMCHAAKPSSPFLTVCITRLTVSLISSDPLPCFLVFTCSVVCSSILSVCMNECATNFCFAFYLSMDLKKKNSMGNPFRHGSNVYPQNQLLALYSLREDCRSTRNWGEGRLSKQNWHKTLGEEKREQTICTVCYIGDCKISS